MAQSNDSILVTPGSGATVATHLLNGKEHQVVMVADYLGHLIGSRDDFMAYYPPQTNAANRTVAELWNGSAAGVVRVRGVWVIPNQAAVAGAAVQFDFNRTTAAGTAGTAVTPNPLDLSAAALTAGIAARYNSTVTAGTLLFSAYHFNEETNAGNVLSQYQNQLPQMGDRVAEIVLRPSQGMLIKQIGANTVAATGAMIYFTQE